MIDNISMLTFLEESKTLIAMFAGIKKQAMDDGFSEEIAERIVLEMLKMQNKEV
jgi:hypothetical protein